MSDVVWDRWISDIHKFGPKTDPEDMALYADKRIRELERTCDALESQRGAYVTLSKKNAELEMQLETSLAYGKEQKRKRLADRAKLERLTELAQAAVDNTVGVIGCDELEALGDYLEGEQDG